MLCPNKKLVTELTDLEANSVEIRGAQCRF